MIWRGYEAVTNAMAEIIAWIGWVLILYCMAFGVSDVFMRYMLNAPSMWIGTTMQAAMVLLACAGGIYAFRHGAFVKLDLFYANAKDRTKALLDLLTVPFTFLFLGVLIWKGFDAAQLSLKLNQMTPTAVPIPIYPIKFMIPITGIIVGLLVIRQVVNDVRCLFFGHPKDADEDEAATP